MTSPRNLIFLNTAAQGVGIMAFQITQGATVDQVYQNYKTKHPNLLVSEGASCDSTGGKIIAAFGGPLCVVFVEMLRDSHFLCAILQRSRGAY